MTMIAPDPIPPLAIDEPLQVCAIDGEIVFIGEGLGFSMTAIAAEETSQRLARLLDEAATDPRS